VLYWLVCLPEARKKGMHTSPVLMTLCRGQEEGGAESQDTLVEQCLLRGLHTVSDGDLPIQTSDFYSKHMLPAKAPGDPLWLSYTYAGRKREGAQKRQF
jgi:hypothetical protein